MSISIITGVPGSGKTYLAVSLLIDEFFIFSPDQKIYIPKNDKIKIVTNIDSLKLWHMKLEDAYKTVNVNNFNQFFTPEKQTEFHQQFPHVVYIIDEAQQYLDPYFRNANVVLYFDTHRHYGDTIYLISQSIFKISRSVTALCAQELRARTSSFSLTGEMLYNVYISGDIVAKKIIRPKKQIYDLYKSMTHDEVKGLGKAQFLKVAPVVIIASIILLCVVGYRFVNNRIKKHGEPKNEKSIQTTHTTSSSHQNNYKKSDAGITAGTSLKQWIPVSQITEDGKVVFVVQSYNNIDYLVPTYMITAPKVVINRQMYLLIEPPLPPSDREGGSGRRDVYVDDHSDDRSDERSGIIKQSRRSDDV